MHFDILYYLLIVISKIKYSVESWKNVAFLNFDLISLISQTLLVIFTYIDIR